MRIRGITGVPAKGHFVDKEFGTLYDVTAQTELAVQAVPQQGGRPVWIPKSICCLREGCLRVPKWWLRQRFGAYVEPKLAELDRHDYRPATPGLVSSVYREMQELLGEVG